MNILLVSVTMPPDGSATASVISHLMPYFQTRGCQVDGVTIKSNLDDTNISIYKGMKIYHANYIIGSRTRRKTISEVVFAIRKRIFWKLHPIKTNIYNEVLVRALVRVMEKCVAERYDVIIPVCAYYDAAEAVLRYKKRHRMQSKIIFYQLDPLAENARLQCDTKHLEAYERALYNECEAVFTTPIIARIKREKGWSLSKVLPVELPLVKRIAPNRSIPRIQDEIRCVFAGYLYQDIRDATYTLELFSILSDPNIHLYILGSGQEQKVEEYERGKLAGRLHRLGTLSEDECSAWLESADVLVNIGNTVMNQIPSKIFTYISYGKTILNICKSYECPTLEYMKQYPLSINLVESESVSNKDAKYVEKSIIQNLGYLKPFEEIQQKYVECTPEYVAKQMLGVIENTV